MWALSGGDPRSDRYRDSRLHEGIPRTDLVPYFVVPLGSLTAYGRFLYSEGDTT